MEIHIEDLSHDARGIGRINGKVIFVEGAYPGEYVEGANIINKKRYLETKTSKIIKASPNRITKMCVDFYSCGGCQFCDYAYSAQLEFKINRVINEFKKFANINLKAIKINGMDKFYNYRNHIQLKVKNSQIGYITKDYKKIFTPKNCIIAPKDTDKIIEILKKWKQIDRISLIGIRENYAKEKMLILVTSSFSLEIYDIIDELKKLNVTHVYENKNNNPKSHYGKKSLLLYGKDDFEDKILGNTFVVSPTSFFQVNRSQAEVLYKKAIENLQLTFNDSIIELYCGVGTITMEIAKVVKNVFAIEYVSAAVEDAKENAKRNNVHNVQFVNGKVEDVLSRLDDFVGDKKYNKLLLDPPRTGVEKNAIDAILKLNPEVISYVSCDPATLARDVGLLTANGNYVVESVEIVDMFPLTSHVETVALLSHKKPDSVINVKVEFGEGEGKVPLDNIAKRLRAWILRWTTTM
ncbi:MAG: 23S rRNA (uracil(1939)-C(5))-methyltransferase RlmD [Treponema sp.]|nr:23S rRNA (uracil(1939)-C(5))-methyltransferase RlmD [Treponema sp.]